MTHLSFLVYNLNSMIRLCVFNSGLNLVFRLATITVLWLLDCALAFYRKTVWCSLWR